MRIAISTDGDFVSAHFGRCPAFTIVDIEKGKVVSKKLIENPGHQPGFIPSFLHERRVDCILTGGMGMRAKQFFSEFNIEAIVGISGRVDGVIDKLVKGKLKGGESLCRPGSGRGYGIDKTECDHSNKDENEH